MKSTPSKIERVLCPVGYMLISVYVIIVISTYAEQNIGVSIGYGFVTYPH